MLEHTFCHLPGIDVIEEGKLWDQGILYWEQFREILKEKVKSPSDMHSRLLLDSLDFSRKEMDRKNWDYFFFALPNQQKWRLFPIIRDNLLYLDIETSGLGSGDFVTVVGTYDGNNFKTYLRGRNMDDFPEELSSSQVFVTYNGAAFDVPFLEKEFGRKFRNRHLDIMYILRSLGIKGGLKGCEKALGIKRDLPYEVNGADAVRLWWQYVQYDDQDALDLLLKYNREDVINLELLFIKAYNLKIKETRFFGEVIPEV
ncbi:ribonuclease H-like domain-containing protein [Leptospira sp. WS58.C1]|uniref:ribonuclease H-like domain-containing protein n=1 Tax=Leptospira TaxID=171 RepID=UPI0003484A75|nr:MULTISPECIES: ribonuclease H-like domain-containing protein [unclassified Leptospira]MCR1794968.1 ribonuclease H-like domain-containing protein [Leptospira sp. id769339]